MVHDIFFLFRMETHPDAVMQPGQLRHFVKVRLFSLSQTIADISQTIHPTNRMNIQNCQNVYPVSKKFRSHSEL